MKLEEHTSVFGEGSTIEVSKMNASLVANDKRDISRDDPCKQLLTSPGVLAFILKNVIEEFKDEPLDEIKQQVTGQLKTEFISSDIHLKPTEYNSITDGLIRYDVLLDVKSKHICTVDIEIQSNEDPGYPLTTRGVYYLSRLISKQLGDVTGSTKYNALHKVYSIWLCPKTPRNEQGGISRFKFQCVDNGAHLNRDNLLGVDLMELIFIRAGTNSSTDIMKFINGLKRDREQLMRLISIDEEVETYMSFWEEERAEFREEDKAAGRAEGRAEGKVEGAKAVCYSIISRQKALGKNEGEIINILVDLCGMQEEDARKYMDSYNSKYSG